MTAPTLQTENKGILCAAESREAYISSRIVDGKHELSLDVHLQKDAAIANHVVPPFRGKPGITLVQDLFGKDEDKTWGRGQEQRLDYLLRTDSEFKLPIANADHPIRWTSGRGLVVVDGYALMNIRGAQAPTDPNKVSDMGGYGENDDLFNPGFGAHREIAEELAIFTPDSQLIVPNLGKDSRGVDFQKIITQACHDTELSFFGTYECAARERKDLGQGSRIRVHMGGQEMMNEELQFLYEPLSNCGIDVLTTLEYNTGFNPAKDLVVGFAEYFGAPGNYTVLGQSNDMAFIKIEDLLEEFDQGASAKPVEAIVTNAYTDLHESRRIDPTNLNGSSRKQLETMKAKNYSFEE